MLCLLLVFIFLIFLHLFNLLFKRHYLTLQIVLNNGFVNQSILLKLFNHLLVLLLEFIHFLLILRLLCFFFLLLKLAKLI